jgi:HSP20 family protein
MALRRMNGMLPVAQLRNEMNRLISDFALPAAGSPRWAAAAFPALNVWEDGDVVFAEAEMPGVKAEDLEISVVNGDLTICGRRGGQQGEGVVYHRRERGTGEFNRVLRLPVDVDAAQVEATLTDGVLRVKLPKAESAKPKKIKVSAG